MMTVLKAIKYIHGQKICHGDIKLENILLSKSDKLKIIDFGLSFDVKKKIMVTMGSLF